MKKGWRMAIWPIFLVVLWSCKNADTEKKDEIQRLQVAMISAGKAFRATGIFPPKTGYEDLEDGRPDPWGTLMRLECVKGEPSLRSAGPDKIYYTEDDLVIEY